MKNQMKKLVAHAITIAAIALAAPAAMASPELVTNGDFSAGSTGWTGTMTTSDFWGVGGSNAMVTGCVGSSCVSTLGAGSFFGQTISTTAGATYDLSFLVGENTGPTSEFTVFWDGLMVADVINPANNTVDFVTNPNMVIYTYSLVATGASTAFEIHGRQDPSGISFDNISVTQSSGEVPEPGSMMLIGAGLLGLVARRKFVNRK
jgi:endoglucanase